MRITYLTPLTFFLFTSDVYADIYAYVGPGLGLGVIGAIIGVILTIMLAILGVFWYPVKRMLKKINQKKDKDETEEGEEA